MVVTNEVCLPRPDSLCVPEVNLSSANLMAAAPYLGKFCEGIYNEFMLCRIERNDPNACVFLGKAVTQCTYDFFKKVKCLCPCEHEQYANCVDKSSGSYQPWPCRKTHEVYKKCMKDKLNIEYPGFGYFCRARVHKTLMEKVPPCKLCPSTPEVGKHETCKLPASKKRCEARFGARNYWMTE